jgi:hypothetical protein
LRTEQEKSLEKGGIDDLQQKAGELHGIRDVQRSIEKSIIGAGLQVMADRYGADKLLSALQTRGVGSFRDVIEKLAPEKAERQALYEAIKTEPMDVLAERFDQTLGGVADGNTHVSAMERARKFNVFTILGPTRIKERVADRIPSKFHRPDDGGHLTDTYGLFSGDFDSLLANNPDLVQSFRETNDTLVLLKGIREIYGAEYEQFSASLEKAKATVEVKVADGDACFVELHALSDDIYYDEIAKLEERLAVASSDEAREMVQSMLDKKSAEFIATHEDFKSKAEAVHNKIIADLGAERLRQLLVARPAEAFPTYNDKEKDVD